MKALTYISIIALTAMLTTAGSSAETVTDFSIGSGYQGNLFNDSNSSGDSYALASLSLKHYPSATAELALSGQYQAYNEYGDLSGFSGSAAATIIPTAPRSKIMLALHGAASIQTFGQLYELYNRTGLAAGADLSYRPANRLTLSTSIAYGLSDYTNADYSSSRGVDLGLGCNISLPGSNALGLRFDYSRYTYDQAPDAATMTGRPGRTDHDNSELFTITGVTARFSRPLGARTGMNIAVGHRRLRVESDYVASGYTIDYLSPWSNLWEGPSISGGIKHFFPHQVTAEMAFAWLDKSYVDVVEYDLENDTASAAISRDDRLTTVSLALARPFLLNNGSLLTPSLQLGYRDNLSSLEQYHYADLWGSLAVRVSF